MDQLFIKFESLKSLSPRLSIPLIIFVIPSLLHSKLLFWYIRINIRLAFSQVIAKGKISRNGINQVLLHNA